MTEPDKARRGEDCSAIELGADPCANCGHGKALHLDPPMTVCCEPREATSPNGWPVCSCNEYEPPLVAGGQGRSAREVLDAAQIVGACLLGAGLFWFCVWACWTWARNGRSQ